MHATRNHFSGAVLACCLGAFGLAHAADVKPAAAPQAATASSAAKPAQSAKTTTKSTKSTKSAKSSKPTKSATTKSATAGNTAKTGKTAAAPATAKPAAVAMPAQPANPYMARMPANPYLPGQPANPYLAYRSANPPQADLSSHPLMALLPADVQKSIKESKTAKLSLSPLPVDFYFLPNQKPTVAFTTPCAQVEKATHGFPVFTAMTNFMYTMAGNINESNSLPIIIEPVCV